MSLAFATLCQSKIAYLPQIKPPASENPNLQDNNNNERMAKLPAYQINVLAALGELSLGLPLDRIKIGMQSGSTFRQILYPQTYGNYLMNGVPHRFRTSMNLSYWFAGHTPSIINRCFIYLPGIVYLNTEYTQKIEPWLCVVTGCPRLASQALIKPILVSLAISPYVCLFEGLKLTQQLGYQRVYPPEIHKFITNGIKTVPSTIITVPTTYQPTTYQPTTYQPTTYQLIRGVMNSGRGGILFASFWPTFARETLFISGMCVAQPQITHWFQTVEISTSGLIFSTETARVLGSLVASFACQTISQPFDVLKTRRETMPSFNWFLVIQTLREDIKNKGTRPVLFSGWLPRCIRGVWTFYSVSAIRDWLTSK